MIIVLQVVLGIFGLSLVVLVHEAGHYLAARMTGIRVETFSVGFGRKIAGFQAGETEYRLSLIPLGGYCRFSGENSFKTAIENKLDRIPADEGDFYAAGPWRRIAVALAGPLANIVFAVLVFACIFRIGYTETYHEPRVILLSEVEGYEDRLWPADRAGLQSGDLILSVEGNSIRSFSDLAQQIAFRPDEALHFVVERRGRGVELTVIPELDRESGTARIGVSNWVDPVIQDVIPDSAAAAAGLKAGDRIVSVDGQEIRHSVDFREAMNAASDSVVPLEVLRQGKTVHLELDSSLAGPEHGLGLILDFKTVRSRNLSFPAAFRKGVGEVFRVLASTWRGLRMLFMGIQVRNAVSGPARLVSDTGALVLSGFSLGFGPGMYWTFRFLAIISVSLAFMNLLPIPVMDGGQILLFVTEWIRRRPIHPGSVYRYQFVGTIIVLIIFVAASAGDVMYFSGR